MMRTHAEISSEPSERKKQLIKCLAATLAGISTVCYIIGSLIIMGIGIGLLCAPFGAVIYSFVALSQQQKVNNSNIRKFCHNFPAEQLSLFDACEIDRTVAREARAKYSGIEKCMEQPFITDVICLDDKGKEHHSADFFSDLSMTCGFIQTILNCRRIPVVNLVNPNLTYWDQMASALDSCYRYCVHEKNGIYEEIFLTIVAAMTIALIGTAALVESLLHKYRSYWFPNLPQTSVNKYAGANNYFFRQLNHFFGIDDGDTLNVDLLNQGHLPAVPLITEPSRPFISVNP